MFDHIFGTNTIWCKQGGEKTRSCSKPFRGFLLCAHASLTPPNLSVFYKIPCLCCIALLLSVFCRTVPVSLSVKEIIGCHAYTHILSLFSFQPFPSSSPRLSCFPLNVNSLENILIPHVNNETLDIDITQENTSEWAQTRRENIKFLLVICLRVNGACSSPHAIAPHFFLMNKWWGSAVVGGGGTTLVCRQRQYEGRLFFSPLSMRCWRTVCLYLMNHAAII